MRKQWTRISLGLVLILAGVGYAEIGRAHV